MKRILTAVLLFALLCLPLCVSFAEDPEPLDVSTDVQFMNTGFAINAITENCTVPINGASSLQVAATGLAPISFLWEVSADNGASFQSATGANANATYEITGAQPNVPADRPYIYRVTVTDGGGYTGTAQTRVLVADDYDYRTIALRNGDTDVSAYMHDETRLVVTPLPENSSEAIAMETSLAVSYVPLLVCDVSLLNQNNQIVPYFGQLRIDFEVGADYEGQTLRVFHYKNGTTEIHTGTVANGILSIIVDELSPFMIEVPEANTFAITAGVTGTGGGISPSGRINVTQGTSRTFTFLPDTGFAVDTVSVNGTAVTPTGNSYTIANVQRTTTINVTFRAVTPSSTVHTVAATGGTHGSIDPAGTVNVRHGEAQTFYFYPASGYELDELLVNGVSVNVLGNSYTISAVEANTTIRATFRTAQTQPPNVRKKITASAGPNGTISPSGEVSVEYGGGMYFYIIPNDGYETDEVRIDDAPVTTGDAYHFTNVISDRTIHATFKALPDYHTITATAGANGSISPSTMRIPDGGSQTFSFMPNSGYEVDTVTVDGTALASPDTSYTFTNVAGAHTISVTFKQGTTPPSPITYHTITVNAPTVGGTISPSGTVQVPENGSQTINFIPNAGYVLDTVTIDGVVQTSPRSSYTFTNVAGAHTVSATFRSITQQHTITAGVSGTGGRISPAGSVLVLPGGAQTFYFIPESGYTVREVRVDGVVQSSAAYQYTFTNVREDHTLLVTFTRTATPPTGDTDNKLLWTLLIIASLLLAVFCLLYLRRLRKPEEPGTASVSEPQKDAQG